MQVVMLLLMLNPNGPPAVTAFPTPSLEACHTHVQALNREMPVRGWHVVGACVTVDELTKMARP